MIDAAIIALAISEAGLRLDDATRARYADDIVASAPDTETRLALVATIKAEAEQDTSRIERCEYRTGEADNGAALGIYQLHVERLQGHSREEVCGSNRLASKLAADHLAHLRKLLGSWRAAFRAYVGARSEDDLRLRQRGKLFERLVAFVRRAS